MSQRTPLTLAITREIGWPSEIAPPSRAGQCLGWGHHKAMPVGWERHRLVTRRDRPPVAGSPWGGASILRLLPQTVSKDLSRHPISFTLAGPGAGLAPISSSGWSATDGLSNITGPELTELICDSSKLSHKMGVLLS